MRTPPQRRLVPSNSPTCQGCEWGTHSVPSVIFSVDAWVSPEDRRVGRRGGVSTLRLWIRDRKRDTEMEREKEAR